jgi:ribosomal protein L29
MKHKTPVTELERMTIQELRKDLQVKRAEVAAMRIKLDMQTEKNSGHYKLQRRDVARMTMVLTRMEKNPATKAAPKIVAAETPKKVSQSPKKPVKRSSPKK